MATLSQQTSEWRLWRVQDVARALNVSRSWVYQQAQQADLPSLRIGGLLRFDPEAVRAWALGLGPAQLPLVASRAVVSSPAAGPPPDEPPRGNGCVPGRPPTTERRLPLSNDEPTVSVREAAAQLGLCTATVYKMAEQGALSHRRVSNAIRIPLRVVVALKNALSR